jgi:hypothetical protein
VLGVWPYLIGSGDPLPEPSANADAVQPYERPAYLPIKVRLGDPTSYWCTWLPNYAQVLPLICGLRVFGRLGPSKHVANH